MRYLLVTCSERASLLVKTIRKYDDKSIITLVKLDQDENREK